MDSIVVENISKKFRISKDKQQKLYENQFNENVIVALDDVTFKVTSGETIGIIGLNGSGKTTLLRLIAGIYQPDSGKIVVNGTIAPLLQIGTGFQPELNALENIITYGMLLGLKKSEIKDRIKPILKFAELERFAAMKLSHFSTGMKARLGFATAIQIDPDILLVDEVLAVGDASFREKSYKEFLSFKERKKTIVFTNHNIKAITKLCDHVLLLDSGKKIAYDKPDKVAEMYYNIINKTKK